MTRTIGIVKAAALVVPWLISASGCALPNDDLIAEYPSGAVDRTQYGGLQIVGELSIGDKTLPVSPLPLDDLEITMLSQCYDELVLSGDPQNVLHKDALAAVGEWVFNGATGDEGHECLRKLALSDLYRCLAFKNLELAEAISVQVYESRPFAYEASGLADLEYSFIIDAARMSQSHRYRIAPIPPDAKTIPLRAAQAAFRKAGVQAALALQQTWDDDAVVKHTCVKHLATGLSGGPYTPDPVDQLVVGLHETIAKLGEATQKAVENELNVASSRLSTSSDYVQAQDLLWNAPINSHASAIDNLVNGYASVAQRKLGTVPVPLATPAQRAAVKLLRSARLLSTFHFQDPLSVDFVSDADLVEKAAEKIYGDLFRGISPQPPVPDAPAFLDRRGLSLADIAVARRYLLAERDALERENEPDQGDPERGFGFSSPVFQHPAGYYLDVTPFLGAWCNLFNADLCFAYAEDGAAQAVDFMREVVDRTLRATALGNLDLTPVQTQTLAAASLAGSSLVGAQRLRLFRSSDSTNVAVSVYGADLSDQTMLRVLTTKRAYRCAVEGSIDGAKSCTETLISGGTLVPAQITTSDPSQPAPRDKAVHLVFADSAWDWAAQPLYLVRYEGIGHSRLLARFKVDRNSGYTFIPLIDDGLFGELLRRATFRNTDSSGLPALACGDTGVDRSFVPPLESELTENSDSYESSYRHFLDLATSSSLEADRLADDMVASGLEMDNRSEQAMRDLEDFCGDVVTLDPFATGETLCEPTEPDCDVVKAQLQANPSLQSCLPSDYYGGGMGKVDYTVLGARSVCIIRKTGGTGAPCVCDLGADCPECPALSDDPSCAVYDTWLADDHAEYEKVFIDRKLNIFASQGTPESTLDPCSQLESLADLVSLRNNSQATPSWQQYKTALAQISWFTPEGLRDILAGVHLGVDILNHYTLSVDGVPIQSTRVNEYLDCPHYEFWKDGTLIVPCLQPGNALKPISMAPDEWLYNELTLYTWTRRDWGDKLFEYLWTLGALADKTDMLRLVDWEGGSYTAATERSYYDLPPGLPMRELFTDAADEPVVCIDTEKLIPQGGNDLSDWLSEHPMNVDFLPYGLCHDNKFRREYTSDHRLSDHSAPGYAYFWSNLPSFFTGTLNEGMLWRANSEHFQYVEVGYDTTFCSGSNPPPCITFSQNGSGPSARVNGTANPEKLLESLRLACYLKERRDDPTKFYSATDGASMPVLNGIEDIPRVRDYLKNVANGIHKQFERLIIANMPETIVENFRPGGTQTLYPEHKGASLDYLLAMDNALQAIATGALDLSRTLVSISDIFASLYLNKEKLTAQDAINKLQTARNVLADVAQGISATNGLKAVDPRAYIGAALFAAIAGIDVAVGVLNDQILEIDEQLLYKESMRQIRDQLKNLQTAAENIRRAFSDLQAAASHLEQNGLKAAGKFAFALGLDSAEAGHVFHSNTVMRRRYNTLRERYERAFLRAKKLAFIARRAIEFRLGVDLGQMDDDMTLVPKPSSWADRVCTMQGFDYRKLREATENQDDPLFDPEVQSSDSYANWYIGDYVKMLSDFVESYNMDYPFTDEKDLAVLSLKNDIMRTRGTCAKPGYNLLAYSAEIGRQQQLTEGGITSLSGWTTGGCISGTIPDCDPATQSCSVPDDCIDRVVGDASSAIKCNSNFCFGHDANWINSPENPNPGQIPAEGTRISDRQPVFVDGAIMNGRLGTGANSGYVQQTVRGALPGYYVLSWWARDPRPEPDPAQPAPEYRVEVLQGGAALEAAPRAYSPPANWDRAHFGFQVPAQGDIEIRIHPSSSDTPIEGEAIPEYGDVLLWGAQLEVLPPGNGRCEGDACLGSGVDPLPFQKTNAYRMVEGGDCEDTDGAEMRKRFTYRCMCLDKDNGICGPQDLGSPFQKCFWEYPFTLSLEAVEASAQIPSNNISVGNFNYRHEATAVNIIGTNVVDCQRTASPSTCLINAFVNYTVEHRGDVEVRNYDRDTMLFSMPTARVEHGKALTAEVVVTNPMTGTHTSLLSDYWKDGMRGRPLQGQYYLRIWDTPGLAWQTVEDVQILWKYRYWTSMGSSY